MGMGLPRDEATRQDPIAKSPTSICGGRGLYLELGESAIFRTEAVEAAHQDEDEEDHGPTDQSEDLADLVADGSVEGEEHGDEADGCERGADPEAVGSNAADGPEDLR